MDWGKPRSFHAAAEAGSLTSAGERLGISQSAVSRQIAALEEQLGVSLFQRHARGLVLTDSGHTLFRSTMEMAQAAQSANTALRDQQETPQGELTVSAPVAFGSTWLVPRLGGFVRKHPDLHLDLRLEDREYDLLKLEAECAIRLWAADKADLIQRKLGTVATNLYASPEYLKANGMPRTPQDLDNHRIIAYGDETSPLHEMSFACRVGRDDAPPRPATLKVNNVFAMLRAVDAGLGIADVPDYMASTMPRLVKVLPENVGPVFDLYFIYPSDLRRSKRVAAFRDFLGHVPGRGVAG
ncbi:MAG: LysR family transcriptional regulator [Hyphomonas sp.]|nr:LysR family transcriptional regulator [Hyphomonas sp.]